MEAQIPGRLTAGSHAPGNSATTGIEIDGNGIGEGYPCFIIAEVGVNHDGDVEKARALVQAAAAAGADAVKFQSFVVDDLVTADAPTAAYQLKGSDGTGSQADMLRELCLDREAHELLIEESSRSRVVFLSSPFDARSFDLLVSLKVPGVKVGSGELTNHPFLRYMASPACPPLLVSTGMATMQEVEDAVSVLLERPMPFALLHCVSSYPAAAADANLRTMDTLRRRFGVPIGFSDHTEGIEVAIAAVALGADLIEKHLTLDRFAKGPDHFASLEPEGFGDMVRGIRLAESALGDGVKQPKPSEAEVARAARRSLVAARALPEGHTITEGDIAILRPGTGMSPARLPSIIGRRTRVSVEEGTLLREDLLE